MSTLLPADKAKWHRDNKSNKTGFIGLTWKPKLKLFVARIRVPGKKEKIHCGQSKSAEDAARMYDAKARDLFGDNAITNFPSVVSVQEQSGGQ